MQILSKEVFTLQKNGVAELFIQTAAERQAELKELEQERNINALFKLAMQAKKRNYRWQRHVS